MKNVKFGLMALAAIVGIGGAFANKPAKFNGTTYYAVSNGSGGFTWQTTRPNLSNFSCQTATPYCTVVTIGGYVPQTNVVPSASQATPTQSNHKVYKPIL